MMRSLLVLWLTSGPLPSVPILDSLGLEAHIWTLSLPVPMAPFHLASHAWAHIPQRLWSALTMPRVHPAMLLFG